MAETEARFPINLEGNASEKSREMADSMEALRSRIQQGESAIREMTGTMRRLRGSTDEVKRAKEELRSKIDAERNAVSSSNLALFKAGTSYDRLAAKSKGVGASTDGAKFALKGLGGSVGGLPEKFENLSKAFSGGNAGMALFAVGAAALVAAVVAVTAAVVAGAIALGKWIVEGANAARAANLNREAWAGSAEGARVLGEHVDALAGKVATPKGELDKLATSLMRAGFTGDELVDSFNAIGQASAALGDEAGGKIQSALAKASKGGLLTAKDFEGTGLDVAGVKLENGAKAIREAVEKQFGGINARKMLDLNVQTAKFEENLKGLTSDVDLDPFLRALSSITGIFDESTSSGAALKALVTVVGNTLGPAFEAVAPIATAFMKGLVIAALHLGIAFLQIKNYLTDTFGGGEATSGIDAVTIALKAGEFVLVSFAATLGVLAVAFGLVAAAIAAPFFLLYELSTVIKDVVVKIMEVDWVALGKSVIDGLINGLTNAAGALKSVVTGLADSVSGGFKSALGIASPSKLFAEFGGQTAAGFAQGVEGGAGQANAAVSGMVAAPSLAGAAGGGGGVTVNVAINVNGGADGAETAKQLTAPSVLAQLTKMIEDALVGAGIPVAT